MRTTLTNAEYDRMMRQIREIASYWRREKERQIAQEVAKDLLLSGRHLAPEATQ